ncbi:MAG: hypothetical protein AAGI63_05715 [Planctomycetota bacterium]
MVRAALLISIVLLPITFSVCSAQQTVEEDDSNSVTRTLENLSRRSYAKRQQATLEIWRRRSETREQVQKAANHPDPEVANRAKWILRQWRLGALPNTPPNVARLLQRSDGPEAIENLLELGEFESAMMALEESDGTIDGDRAYARTAAALERRFPIYVHEAVERESLPQLIALLDRVADSSELALCRLQLLEMTGVKITDETLLPTSAENWAPADVLHATCLLLVARGNIEKAIRLAEQSVDPDLLPRCLMLGARWREAAELLSGIAKQTDAGTPESFQRWAMTLIAADRCHDDELIQQSVDALVASPNEAVTPEVMDLRWKTLASHGHIDEAIQTAIEANPDDAGRLALSARRPKEAIEALGFSLERLDLDLPRWIDDAVPMQRLKQTATSIRPEMRRLLSLVKVLISIGRDDAGREIAHRISKSPVTLSGSVRMREYLLLTLTNTRRKDWLLEYTVLENERSLSNISLNTISRILPDADESTMRIVFNGMTKVLPNASPRKRFQATYQLINGELPEGFDPKRDFQRLYDVLTISSRTAPNRPDLYRAIPRPNVNTAKLFARHGESDLARAMLDSLVKEGDLEALFFMAEQQLNGGRAEIADAYFEAVFKQISRPARDGGRYLTDVDSAMAVKALIGRWSVAKRLGDEQQANSLEQKIQYCLCTPSVSTRSATAEYLGDRGLTQLALQAYEMTLPLAALRDSNWGSLSGDVEDDSSLYDVARVYSTLAFETHPTEAAHWFDLAVCGAFPTIEFAPGGYLLLPFFVQRWQLEEAIKRNDAEAVALNLRRIMELDPLNVDFAERLLPKMRKAGMTEMADQVFNDLVDRGIQHAETFPFDAMSANNVAWVAAMNEQRLQDAVVLSRKAVRAEPESAVYRDTLAEILFQLDEKQQALQIEQGCLLDDPGQWHLHEQIEKYQQAIKDERDGPGNES